MGRYEIRSLLGAGGMGEVYLAQDLELDRFAAVKILSPEFASDQQRVLRFIQEAKAASALNHPNIVTIYESGKSDTAAFIATEFIDGVPLRQRMQPCMELSDVLDIAIQVASALATAHAAGIVHRDMKPENVMIRPDGYVKVLDFGLAKLTEARKSDSEATTLIETEPGLVMGTTRYMSPEQVRAQEVDARTDIWSLGVMLYEMCAERPPFGGSTNSDVMVAILERDPPPLARYCRGVPESLEWVITKSLNKERDERYQTIKEMLSDLKKVKRREELDAEIERSTPPDTDSSSRLTTKSDRVPFVSRTAETAAKTSPVTAPAQSSAEYFINAVKGHKRMIAGGAAVLAVALGVISLALFYKKGQTDPNPPPPKTRRIEQLTNSGNVTAAAISSDGKYLVYEADDNRSLWLKTLSSGNVQPIVQASSDIFSEPSFSPDGSMVFYSSAKTGQYSLYQIAISGGAATKLAELGDRPEYTFSPDGKRLAFTRTDAEGQVALIIANRDGSNQKTLASHQTANWCTRPTWSPDGNTIACPAEIDEGEIHQTLVGIAVADGNERSLTSRKWQQIDRLAWLPDSKGLFLTAQDNDKVSLQVLRLTLLEDRVESITRDQKDYFGLVITANAQSLVTLRSDTLASVWVDEAKLPFESNRNVSSFAWTADGRIVYDSETDDGTDLWIAGPSDKTAVRLTTDGNNRNPAVSPDGAHIVFMKGPKDEAHVWRMDHDRSLHQLTNGVGESSPCVSPDGNWIVYKVDIFGLPSLWKMTLDGKDSSRLTERPADAPIFSPAGDLIACAYTADATTGTKIGLIPFAGGKAKQFDVAATALFPVHWINDGKALAYVDVRDGVSNIWAQPVAGGSPTQLTKFNSGSIFWFDWSRDGKHLALARGASISDVVLISNLP